MAFTANGCNFGHFRAKIMSFNSCLRNFFRLKSDCFRSSVEICQFLRQSAKFWPFYGYWLTLLRLYFLCSPDKK